MPTEPKYIVVVGASAGGLHSVIELCAQLKEDVDMAVFVVLHITKISVSDLLIQRIQKNSAFTCVIPENNEAIKTRHIYIAMPDKHLIVKKGYVVMGEGTAENRWRPSIDVLFRSAAAAYSSRVIGIILSGLLEDGTAGMMAIKRSGGTCIVQDPNEAEYPDMPQSVMNNLEVDYCLRLQNIGAVLQEKSKDTITDYPAAPPDVIAEAALAERVSTSIEQVASLGDKSLFSCPDCGGGLWEMKHELNGFTRYRCHTGHVYTQDELEVRSTQALENTLWVALRMLEERKMLLLKMSLEEEAKGWQMSARNKRTRGKDLEEHIQRLKDILFETKQTTISEKANKEKGFNRN